MNTKLNLAVAALLMAGAYPVLSPAQTSVTTLQSAIQENFTGSGTSNTWYWFNGACLTASTTAATTSPGQIPACTGDPYYGSQTQVGGNSGNLNAHPDNTDPTSMYYGGALRLTNDANDQSGAIISNFSFPLQQYGLQVTFTTETYEGDSGGGNSDGADGISFFLQDASIVGALQTALAPGLANPTLGDWGGSLGYTCSNSNDSASQGYDGMVGAYIGLGIDEYGNFLNPGDNTSTGPGYVPNRIGLRGSGSTKWSFLTSLTPAVVAANTAAGTASLYTTPTSHYYPSTLSPSLQQQAVYNTCRTGRIWDYSLVALGLAGSPTETSLTVPNYAAIPNAFKVLTTKIANEAATKRGYGPGSTSGPSYGVPISYNLTITTAGLLSLSYSYNGGVYQQVITGQNITQNNGPIPAAVRFGFAGSTGGSRNIHEIMCFQAIPQNASSSSAGLNEKQTAKVQIGTQVYFAFYNANNWTGSLTSQNLYTPAGDTIPNDLQIDPVVNWDASCVLTGVVSGQTCAKTGAAGPIAPMPTTRTILTWNGSSGIPFEWNSLNSTEQGLLDAEEEAAAESITSWRLNYLRGSRADEQNAYGLDPNTSPTPPNPAGLRARTSVLADIVDSSPTWVGPPNTSYPNLWSDFLYSPSQDPLPENSGKTYGNFASAGTTAMNQEQQRLNVVYVGANDGLLHGFETGSFNSDGTYNETNNDGKEVFAYMPGYVLNDIDDAFTTTLTSTTTTTPPITTTYTTSYSTNVSSDFTDPQYGHKFSVDAAPGMGDLFYNGTWHTWLVGGLGPGGKAIFALDITDPNQFSETNAANLVIGEWSAQTSTTPTVTTSGSPATTTITALNNFSTSSTLTCQNDIAASTNALAHCANSLGNTYGIPQIRRMHNGQWAAIFGNGQHSSTGDAGVYVMLVSPSGGTQVPTVQFYYLSSGWAAAGLGAVTFNPATASSLASTTYGATTNGIYYATPTDLDGDHIVDYIYAGDLQGNIWRFDVTSTSAATWASTPPTLVYSTSPSTTAGNDTQPITTKVIVASIASTNGASPNPRVLVEFGTGQQTAFTNTSAATYTNAQQAIYGIWDSNLSCWNSLSTVQYATMPSAYPSAPCTTPSYTTTPPVYGTTYLQAQTVLGSYSNNTAACAASVTCTEYYRTISSNAICWADFGQTCTSGQTATQYGWYLNLSAGNANAYDANDLFASSAPFANPYVYEQVIFSPTLADGALLINTTIPATTSLRACQSTAAGGWTMAINPATGGAFPNSFFGDANHNFLNINNQIVSGIALGGTGSVSVVANGPQAYVLTQTTNGTGNITAANVQGTLIGSRLTWAEKR
jgi:type IV pilus assembly protein PilY1